MSHFTFDEGAHVYAIGSRHVPSVTQVLDAVGMSPDLSHLPEYYRDRGRAVHRAMALHLLGTLDESTLDERIVGFVQNGMAWLENIEAVPIAVETRWVHREHEYGGTVDLVCDSKLGVLIVDWKTTFTDPAYDVQVAGGYEPLMYDAAGAGAIAADNYEIDKARICIVTLKQPMGKTHWVARHTAGGTSHHDTFLAALNVVRWRRANGR